MVKNIYISVSIYITDSLCCTNNIVKYASMQKKKKKGVVPGSLRKTFLAWKTGKGLFRKRFTYHKAEKTITSS